MRNKGKDARQIAANKERIMAESFRLFAQRGIESVTMPQIAQAGGVNRSSVYRYYPTKLELVIAVSAWLWERFMQQNDSATDFERMTAAEEYEFYLNSFLNLYRDHRDILRFNQFFNIYVANEGATPTQMKPYTAFIEGLAARFRSMIDRARRDGTLRVDVRADEIFSATLHLMLAAVTRYAVGLVYDGSVDPEAELILLKNMLFKRYAR